VRVLLEDSQRTKAITDAAARAVRQLTPELNAMEIERVYSKLSGTTINEARVGA
jgi:hypothetical protein